MFAQMLSEGKTDDVKELIKQACDQPLTSRVLTRMHAEILYAPYIKRELLEVKKSEEFRTMAIPTTFSFKDIPGLSKELQEKLLKHKPATIAQAGLIQGMTPAAISLLIFRVREVTR